MINFPAKRGKRQEGCGVPNTEDWCIAHWVSMMSSVRRWAVADYNGSSVEGNFLVVSIVHISCFLLLIYVYTFIY